MISSHSQGIRLGFASYAYSPQVPRLAQSHPILLAESPVEPICPGTVTEIWGTTMGTTMETTMETKMRMGIIGPVLLPCR
jgi:hypothetical protein